MSHQPGQQRVAPPSGTFGPCWQSGNDCSPKRGRPHRRRYHRRLRRLHAQGANIASQIARGVEGPSMKTSANAARPRRSFFMRLFRWLFSWKTRRRVLLALVSLFTFIALLVTEENWRGKRAWENFKREWEAKGERFDLAAFMPKSVPDDQNFVMISVFAPLLERERRRATGNWKDTNVLQNALDVYGGENNKRAPSFGSLKTGKLTDLREWQKFYRANTNFPSAPQPQSAAKDVLLALDKFDPALKEMRDASRRAYAGFPLYQEKHPMFPVIHLSYLKSEASVLRLRAMAFLED